MSFSLNDVHTITLYTGSNGRKGCTCKCLGCYMGKYGSSKPMYQGTMEQIYKLSSILPNLKKVVIFGNPDVSVDSKFCNQVARYFQSQNPKMQFQFWTSGIGGEKTIRTLVDGINIENIERIGFSVDSIDDKKLSEIKGVNIKLERILEGIKYCQAHGIPDGVILSIWKNNINEDIIKYREFFKSYGVSKFNFHFGSIEGAEERMKHVSEKELFEIRNKYSDIRIPYVLANDEEYQEYLNEKDDYPWIFCTNNPHEITVILEKDGIKASVNCPIMMNAYPELITDIEKLSLPLNVDSKTCPVSEYATGYKPENSHAICRYFKSRKFVNQEGKKHECQK